MVEVRKWILVYLIEDADNGLGEMDMDGNVAVCRLTTGQPMVVRRDTYNRLSMK